MISPSPTLPEYLAYLRTIELLDLYYAGDFLVMASTLMQIKARMLLPRPPEILTENEEEEEEDPRRELVERLLEYKKVKEASAALRAQEEKSSRVFYRPGRDLIVLEEEKPGDPLGRDRPWITRRSGVSGSFTPPGRRGCGCRESILINGGDLQKLRKSRSFYFSALFPTRHQKGVGNLLFGPPGTDSPAKDPGQAGPGFWGD